MPTHDICMPAIPRVCPVFLLFCPGSTSSHPVLASLVPLPSPVVATALCSITRQCTLAAISRSFHSIPSSIVSPSPVCIIADPFQVLCLTLTYLFSDCHLLISRPTVLHACCVHKIIRHQVFLGAFLLLQCPTTTSFPLLPSATAFFQVFHSFLGFVPLPSLSRHLTMTIV